MKVSCFTFHDGTTDDNLAMPVDLALFRPSQEGGILEEVQKWQELRYGTLDESADLLHNLYDWDLERRAVLRQLNEGRALLNTLQRSLAPRKNKAEKTLNDDYNTTEIRSHIKELKSKAIPDLERKYREITEQIDQSLPMVANYVDTTPLDSDPGVVSYQEVKSQTVSGSKETGNNNEIVLDPLFCLGGYETVQLGESDAPKVVVLTGIGASLARALSDYSLSFLLEQTPLNRGRQELSNYQLVNLPGSIRVSPSLAHALLGCRPATCNTSCAACQAKSKIGDSSSLVAAPPLVAFSMLHGNKTYWDRQLPQSFVCTTKSCCNVGEPALGQSANNGSKTKKKTLSWMDQSHGLEETDIFCLTTCSLIEARHVQNDIVHQIVAFHQSLLVDASQCTAIHQSTDALTQLIQCRAVPPTALLPNEASRIVIEGFIPKTRKYITLGFVSNLTDYASRGCKTKCGGMDVEYVYTLHGRLCSVTETMEWVVQNNVVHLNTNELGVGLPSHLARFLRVGIHTKEEMQCEDRNDEEFQETFLFVPFQRRLLRNKSGKVTMKELTFSSQPRLVAYTDQSNVKNYERPSDAGPKVISTARPVSNESKRKPFVRDRPPTRDEVKAEALSNPYSFLPVGF